MIQRIQSVYLVLAVIALAILFFPISFGDLKAGSTIAKTPALSDGTLNLEDNNLSMICTFAGIALFMLGSGPIRGFAVVLCLGILISMFSAVTVSRAIVNFVYGYTPRLTKISI